MSRRKPKPVPETGNWVTLKVSSKAPKCINKLGIYQYVKKQQKKGLALGVKL